MALNYEVKHELPGRVRLRVPLAKSDPVFAERLQSFLQTRAGVYYARTNKDCGSALVCFEPGSFDYVDTFSKLSLEDVLLCDSPVGLGGSHLEQNRVYKIANILETPPRWQFALGLLSLASAVFSFPTFVTRNILVLASIPIFGRGIRTAIEERRAPVEFLDAPALLLMTFEAAYMPAACMATLIGFGEFIRDLAAVRSEEMLDELLSLSRSSAWLVKQDKRVKVPVDKVRIGDEIVVYTGEQIPVNSIVLSGSGTIVHPESHHDSLPVELAAGAHVQADSVLLEGKLYLRCTGAKVQQVMDRIMERERRRMLYRTQYQRNALKRAYRIVAPILFFAAGAFTLSRNLNQALTIICFDFVTGVRIALPTAILSFMYCAGTKGVLIKTGAALETLADVDVIIFARTGVITTGQSEVVKLVALSADQKDTADGENYILSRAAAVEYRYHHPSARAIYRYAKKQQMNIVERKDSMLYPGMGVSAVVNGERILVGSRRLMKLQGLSIEDAKEDDEQIRANGNSVAYVAVDGKVKGLIAYKDNVRVEAANTLQELRALGINELIMTSGDSGASVEQTANQIKAERVFSQLSPEEKAELVRDYQLRGKKVAVVGDDVSDALAMAQSDLSIAMSESTDLARYRADIIITDDDLSQLPYIMKLSREANTFMRQNMLLVSIPNWLGLLLSLTNVVGPARATVLNNGSVILAALNGLRPAINCNVSKKSRPEQAI